MTEAEETTLSGLYARDVHNWSWSTWTKLVERFGQTYMGLTWVVLPYKPSEFMPTIRRRMNELYYQALEEKAGEFGLLVRMDEKNHLVLYNGGEGNEGS